MLVIYSSIYKNNNIIITNIIITVFLDWKDLLILFEIYRKVSSHITLHGAFHTCYNIFYGPQREAIAEVCFSRMLYL